MTLRLRYHSLFLSLFAGLALANVALFHFIARSEVAWGLAAQAKGYAICLSVFLGREPALSAETFERLRPALQRLSRTGNLGLRCFEFTGSEVRSIPLLPESPESPMPPPPSAELLATLRESNAAAALAAVPAADFDLSCGYATILAADGRLRAVVGIAMRDTAMRSCVAAVWRSGALFIGLSLFIGLVAAETLTRSARRGIARLQADASALVRGDYARSWEPIRVAELNDLGHTLQSIAEILRAGIRQTRRRFVQAELLPRQEDTSADCQELCDAAPLPTGAGPQVVVRRINHGFPEDFWGLRSSAEGWCLAAGRLLPPATETELLAQIVRSNAARDYVLGSALIPPPADLWAQLALIFPCARGELVCGTTTGRLLHSAFPATAGPVPTARGVVGTLEAASMALACEYLRQFPDQPLAAVADKLATILSVRDRGLLVLYETVPPPQ
jgi:hypothetical protein